MAPSSTFAAIHSLKAAAHGSGCTALPVQSSSPRLWTMPPEPMTSTPSSRRGASARPISRWWRAPSSDCTESWVTGMSASGYIQRSGTQPPWSMPRSGSIAGPLADGGEERLDVVGEGRRARAAA